LAAWREIEDKKAVIHEGHEAHEGSLVAARFLVTFVSLVDNGFLGSRGRSACQSKILKRLRAGIPAATGHTNPESITV